MTKRRRSAFKRCDHAVFRRFHEMYPDGETLCDEVVALFPDLPFGQGLVTSYMHNGQHGAASYPWLMERTRSVRSTDPDVVALKEELRRLGYKLCTSRRRRRAKR